MIDLCYVPCGSGIFSLNTQKTPTGARFTVASKNCSTKPLSNVIFKVFKIIFNHVERFHRKKIYLTHAVKCFRPWKIYSQLLKN